MNKSKRDELRKHAEKATKGKWTMFRDPVDSVGQMLIRSEIGTLATVRYQFYDAVHIEAFQPETAIALLDALDEMEAKERELLGRALSFMSEILSVLKTRS